MSAASQASAVTVRFYGCATPTRQTLVASGHLSPCDLSLLDWLESLIVGNEPWQPQARMRVQLSEQVAAAQATALIDCQASRFPPEPTPGTGMALRVASQLRGGAGEPTIDAGSSGMKALLALRLSAPPDTGSGGATGGSGAGTGGGGGGGAGTGGSSGAANPGACTPIPFPVLHRVVTVGGNTYLQNTLLSAQGVLVVGRAAH